MCVKIRSKLLHNPGADSNSNPHSNLCRNRIFSPCNIFELEKCIHCHCRGLVASLGVSLSVIQRSPPAQRGMGAWWMWSTTANRRGAGCRDGSRGGAATPIGPPRNRLVPQVAVSGQQCRGGRGAARHSTTQQPRSSVGAPAPAPLGRRWRGRCRAQSGRRSGGGSPLYRAAAPQQRRRPSPAGGGGVGAAAGGRLATVLCRSAAEASAPPSRGRGGVWAAAGGRLATVPRRRLAAVPRRQPDCEAGDGGITNLLAFAADPFLC